MLIVEDGTGVRGATSYVSVDMVRSSIGALLPDNVTDATMESATLQAHLEVKSIIGTVTGAREDSLYLDYPLIGTTGVPASIVKAVSFLTVAYAIRSTSSTEGVSSVKVEGLFQVVMEGAHVPTAGKLADSLESQARDLLIPYTQNTTLRTGRYSYV